MGQVVSTVGGLLGIGPNNNQFQATNANIVAPTTAGDVNNATTTANNGLATQSNLATAILNQNGTGNQNQVFNALTGVASGTGPNPAQTMLNTATGQNVANTAALMAGQRGAGANVGLLARQAGQQGAATQENAVGQGATMEANQQLNALNSQAGIANNEVTNATGAVQGLTSAQQNEQANLMGAIANQNNATVSSNNNVNSANSSMAQTNANNSANSIGGLVNAAGGAISKLLYKGGVVGMSDGGVVPSHIRDMAEIYHPHLAAGGVIPILPESVPSAPANPGGKSAWSLDKWATAPGASNPLTPTSTTPMGAADLVPPGDVMFASKGGAIDFRNGGKIPGKALVKGDSPKNDTVPVMASPGEAMLPRHIMESDNPPEAAKQFVMELMKKYPQKDDADDFKKALKIAIKGRKS